MEDKERKEVEKMYGLAQDLHKLILSKLMQIIC